MVQLLYKYLIINRQVALPGVGVFYIQRKPAKLDYSNKVFTSPDLHINFNASAELPDKRFYQFITHEKKIDEAEAVKKVYAFADRLNQQIKSNKLVQLPGIGTLSKNAVGQVIFQPSDVLSTYFPPTTAGIVLTDDKAKVSHKISTESLGNDEELLNDATKKSWWWLYAIILAVIAIGAILYYYYINGSLR